MKSVRHAMILQLIESTEIETQDGLAKELKRKGLAVTQATVSRDIKELRLTKEPSERGRYRYVSADRGERGQKNRFIRIFSESVVAILPAGNLIVVKTIAATAPAAAEAIDSLRWPEVVGTLAGENTVFVALSSLEDSEPVSERFRELMK